MIDIYMFLLYTALIILLYFRTWKYKQLIDDPVPREGYLWCVPDEKQDPQFYEKQKSYLATFVNISTHIAVCLAIHVAFGWKVALMYSVFPLNVHGTAWTTGNYYMTTVLFIVVGYIINQFGGIWVVLSLPFFFSALHSTVSAIPYAFFMILYQFSYVQILNIIPLCMFLFGKRFKSGLKIRKEGHEARGIDSGTSEWQRIFLMVKVVAYYIYISFWPSKLGFFHQFLKKEDDEGSCLKPTKMFYMSLAVCAVFLCVGLLYSWKGCLWFFLFIGIYSQYTTFGQLVAERYTTVSNIGFCMIMCSFLEHTPTLFWVLCTLYFYRSHIYIPAWKHNINLFSYSLSAHPKAPENYTNLSSYYLEHGQPFQAIRPLMCAIENTNGNKFKLYVNLAGCYGMCSMFEKALYCTGKALETAEIKDIEGLETQYKDLEVKVKQVRREEKYLKNLFAKQ